MSNIYKKLIIIVIIALFLVSCVSNSNTNNEIDIDITNANYIDYVDENDIKRDLSNIPLKYRLVFSKYMEYEAPNGNPIYILAQKHILDEQLIRSYNILKFYLTDTDSYDKTDIANSIADSKSVIVMPNFVDGSFRLSSKLGALFGQPVYFGEAPFEGQSWYQNNNYEHRDASFEEIFHFVHDYGIGTTSNIKENPILANEIKSGMDKALPNEEVQWGLSGNWGLNSKDWLIELKNEGSLEQEYIVSGIDSYFGLWQAFTESEGGMWGIYTAKNREEVKLKDPAAAKIIHEFIGDYLTYMARISPDFSGTFKMNLDESIPYTYKSQYLNNARLLGNLPSNIEANDRDNILIGNNSNNIIDGKKGYDIVQYSAKRNQFKIIENNGNIIIQDLINKSKDELHNIEIIRFIDIDYII